MRIPGPKWGAGRPPLETPLPLVLQYLWRASAAWGCAIRIGRTPRRFAAGASVPLGKAASACALATAAAPLPLRVWGLCPLAPAPLWLTFSCPCVPRLGTFAGHARLGGCAPWPPTFPVRKSSPIMRVSAWDNVRNGFCGNAFANLPEAPAAQRLGVPSNPDFIASFGARLWPQATLARQRKL